MRYKVFDLEILRTVEEVGGWDATDKMGVSCCVVYDSKSRSFRVFGDGEETRAIHYILECDLVVGFNHVNFDWRVLLKIPKNVDVRSTPPLIVKPQYDILLEVRKAAGATNFEKGFKLEHIAQANLDRGKRMTGDLAPKVWQAGKYCDVIDYCIDDVTITRDLFEKIINWEDFLDPRTQKKLSLPDPDTFIADWLEARRVDQKPGDDTSLTPV